MAIAEPKPTVETALVSVTNDDGTAFVAHPSQPLNDVERNEFLHILEDDSEPNDALSAAAARYKSRKL